MRRRINIKPDDVTQLVDELRIGGELEMADTMRLEARSAAGAPNGAARNADGLRHHRAGPVRDLAGWVLKRQMDDPLRNVLSQRLGVGRSRLVAKKAPESLLHEALPPAPDAGLEFAGPAHDFVRADPAGAEQDDCHRPSMFLGGVAIPNNPFEPTPIRTRNCDGYSRAYGADSLARQASGMPSRLNRQISST